MKIPKTNFRKPSWIWIILGLLILGGLLLLALRLRQPGTASISAPKQSVAVGRSVTVPIILDTNGLNINAAEVFLNFNSKLLQVDSVSKDDSIFSIWVTGQPSFNNQSGEISFAGGIPTPGFTGRGRIGSVTFTAKQAARTELVFDSRTQALLNDGQGTSVSLRLDPVEVNIK
jgi:LPXTG-motif cell wall-anchored protein